MSKRVDDFLERQKKKGNKITVTSGFRKGSKGAHGLNQARDVRTRDTSPEQQSRLLNDALLEGFSVGDERKRTGAPHIHIAEKTPRRASLFNVEGNKLTTLIPDAKDIIAAKKHEERMPTEKGKMLPAVDNSPIRGLGGNPYSDEDMLINKLTSVEADIEEKSNRAISLRKAAATPTGQNAIQKALQTSDLSPEQAEMVVDKLSSDEKTSAAILGKSEEKVLGVVDRSNNTSKKAKEDSKVSSQFVEALSFFLPNLLGGLVGSAIAGEEGFVAGESRGGQLGQSFREYELQKEQLAAKKLPKEKERKIDITPEFMDKESQTPLFTRETDTGVEFFDAEGNIYSSDKVISMKLDQGTKREERLEAQSKRNFSQKQNEEGIKAIDKFKASNKGDIDQLRNLKLAKTLVSGKQLSADQLATFNAKAVFGEARITDEDVARAQIPRDLLQKIKDKPQEALTGKLGPEGTKNAKKLLDIIVKKKQKMLRKSAKNNATAFRARAAGLSPEELEKEFLLAVDVDQEEKSSGGFSREEIEAMKAKIRSERGN